MTVTTVQGRTGILSASLYLGAAAADPTTQTDGSALVSGNYYFNTGDELTYTYNGATWAASDINTANLAASGGAALVGHGESTVAEVLDMKVSTTPLAWQDFLAASDGPLTNLDSGDAWLTATTPGYPTAALSIISGRMTNAANTAGGTAAGHALVNLGQSCARIGAEFEFSSGSTTSDGLAALVLWSQQLVYPGPVVDTAMHLTISLEGWGLSSFQSSVNAPLTQGTFLAPLVAGTIYRVEVNVSGNTVTILLPDGSIVTATQPLLATIGTSYAGWEVIQGDATTDAKAKFLSIWADTYTQPKRAPVPNYGALLDFFKNAAKALMPVAAEYPPTAAGNVSVSVPGGSTEVNSALRCSFIAPPSGTVLVQFSGQVLVSVAGLVLWECNIVGWGSVSRQAALSTGEQIQNAKFKITGLTPGNAYATIWNHRATSGAATLRLNAPGGQVATVVVTPLATT
jgi:hypothetical protein